MNSGINKYNLKLITMRKELENRLVELALSISRICKKLDKSFLSQHLTTQIIRSSTSAALNYGEAQAAESRNDFIHKTSVVLKELRETKVSLKLIVDSIKKEEMQKLFGSQDECDQLVAIFHKTVMSAKQKK